MTVQNTSDYDTGLEDFDSRDGVLPRIKIVHEEGLWEDNLSNQRMSVLRFIPLGLVKQRVLFHNIVEDGDVPMCKSPDFNQGFVNLDAPSKKSFPWAEAGFDPSDYPPNQDGQVVLPCNGCQLKEWGSHPALDTPYCSEQWTLPLFYDATGDEGDGSDPEWMPALMTLQKTSLKPIRSYLTPFSRTSKAPFQNVAHGTLKVLTRGRNEYSVPSFSKGSSTDPADWSDYAEQYRGMRAMLTQAPRNEEDAPAGRPTNNENKAPEQQQAAAQAAAPPQTQPEPTPAEAQPQAQAAPAQAAPPQAAPPQQAAAPTPAPAADDDDLPF